jgi:arylformamidase
MSAVDFEVEYNNRNRVAAYPEISARWEKESAALRAATRSDLDIAYGKGDRQKYDLFHPKAQSANTPLAVFIHGGYWQRGDRKSYSFVAKALTEQGISVAVPSYTLAPQASLMDIVGELRIFLKALWERTRRRPVVSGNSAGGHLTGAMLATDWSKTAGVPSDLVRCGYAISGVYDLAPLIPTSINAPLKLDAAKAREASPLFWEKPAADRTFVAAVGGDESQEFIRQSLEVTAAWSRAGVKAECVVVPSTNHFTIVDEFQRPDSALVARIAAMARQSG